MQKKYIALILALSLSILSASVSIAQGLNYTPDVGLGDELIWKIEENFEGEIDIIYRKYNISEIFDLSDETFIKAEYSSSENNLDYTYHSIHTIGWLAVYSEHALDLMDYDIITPKTKIGAFKEEFQFHYGSDYEIRSIASGYGIKITWNENSYLREFSKQGIMEKTEYIIDGQKSETILYSINGEVYRFIPGYPIWMFIASSLIGILGLFFYLRSQMKKIN